MTLLAIVLSVGLVVDDAIVVVENVERHIREGRTPLHAALVGARELVGPIIAMTITLAAVYVPIGFQGGLTGALFREFAFTLAGAVFISGVVALTLSPMMSSRLLRAEHAARLVRAQGRSRVRRRHAAATQRGLARRCASARRCTPCGSRSSLLVIPMYLFSPERARAHTKIRASSSAPSTCRPTRRSNRSTTYTAEVNTHFASTPEFEHSFQISFPTGGFGGMLLKPWKERKRTVFPIEPS